MSVFNWFHFPINVNLGQKMKFSVNLVKHFNICEGASIYNNWSIDTPIIILWTETTCFYVILPNLKSNGLSS